MSLNDPQALHREAKRIESAKRSSAMKSLPKNLHREGARIYYGNMWVATVHVDINLIKAIKDQNYLLRFGEKNREEVFGPRLEERLRE